MTIFWTLFFSVLGLDFGSKMMVRSQMAEGAEIRVLPFFSLTHINNTGIAFGMFQNQNQWFLIFGIAVVLILIWVGVRAYRNDKFTSRVLAAVVGGAVGNLIDRAAYGRVTDFLDFYIGRHHWPAFNVADAAICVGMCLLIIHSFQHSNVSDPV